MRKICDSFLVVCIVLAILSLVSIVITAISSFLGMSYFIGILESVMKAYNEAMAEAGGSTGSAEIPTGFISAMFVFFAVTISLSAAPYIVLLILSIKGRKTPSKGIFIAHIVFGLLLGSVFHLSAGIMGLCILESDAEVAKVQKKLDQLKQQQEQPKDPEPTPAV